MKAIPGSLEVDVTLNDAMPTDEQSEADFQSLLHMTKIAPEFAKHLRSVGLHMHRQGIIQTQRGMLYVTQAWVLSACRDLYRLMQAKAVSKDGDGKDVLTDEVCKIADCLGKLAGKQAALSEVILLHEPVKSGDEDDKPAPTPSFPAGAVIIGGNAEAHFHQTSPSEKTVAKPPIEA